LEKSSQEQIAYSREDLVFGLSWEKWAEKWWQWCMQFPTEKSPLLDPDGRYCAIDQPLTSVWFLFGTSGGNANRYCRISSERAIFFPLVNDLISFAEYSELKTEKELHEYASADLDEASHLYAVVDGTKLEHLENNRVHTELFDLDLYTESTGLVRTTAASDGYWVFLKTLPSGRHTIAFGGEKLLFDDLRTNGYVGKFRVNVTYDIEID
jgi:hypothetical protein